MTVTGTLPLRPRLLPGLVPVPAGDGLVVAGGHAPQMFRGGAATTLLPRLLAILDGSATIAELAVRLETAEPAIAAIVALLRERGLVEEGADGPAAAGPGQAWMAHAAAMAGGPCGSGTEALRKLRAARVRLQGDRQAGAELSDLLRANGVRLADGLCRAGGANRPALTVHVRVGAAPAGEPAALADVGSGSAEAGPAVLLVLEQSGGRLVSLGRGPVVPPEDGCARAAPPWQRRPSPRIQSYVLALAATEITHLVAGVGLSTSDGSILEIDAITGRVTGPTGSLR